MIVPFNFNLPIMIVVTSSWVGTSKDGRPVCLYLQGFSLPAGAPCSLQISQFTEQKDSMCSLSHTPGNNSGRSPMPTPTEYRLRARECLELTDEANQWYVKSALMQLAAEFQKRAERLERSNEGP